MSKSTNIYYWDGAWQGPEANQTKVRITDSLLKPKFAEITIADLDHVIQDAGNYSAYTRVKITDITSSKTIFFGRIEFIEARNSSNFGPSLVLQCRDFLSELTEGTISRDFSGPATLGALLKDIIDYYSFTKVEYKNLAGGAFTVSEYDNIGYWVKSGAGSGRIIYDDTVNDILVLTDVISAETFIENATMTEYSDDQLSVATGVSADCNADLVHNIDTSSIGAIGAIDVNTTKNYTKSSYSPLEAITQLCIHGSSAGVYHFFLDEAAGTSHYPPVFTLFEREARPAGGPSTNGLTIKYEGTTDTAGQERSMDPNYSFPLPEREIYTEAIATTLDADDALLTSSKKAGAVALSLEVFKQREFQAIEHYTQAGLNNSVDRFMGMTGTASIQRGKVGFVYYPYFKKTGTYTVIHAGDMVFIENSRITYATGGVNMVVIKIEYEEPNGMTSMLLLEETYGIGPPEYTYANPNFGTNFPPNVDIRIPIEYPVPPWSDILPQAVQGYQHDVIFAAVDNNTITITDSLKGITFNDGTTQEVDWIAINGNLTYDLVGAEVNYVYFDLSDANPEILKVVDTVALYRTAMAANPGDVGLLCLAQTATVAGMKATVIPSYGKEPLITADIIDMSGIKTYDYGGTNGFIQSIMATQMSGGYLKLTSDTVKDGTWYSQTGVVVDATAGISIYGGEGISGLRTFTNATDYAAGTPVQCYIGTDGKFYAGAGTVILDTNGIIINGAVFKVQFGGADKMWIVPAAAQVSFNALAAGIQFAFTCDEMNVNFSGAGKAFYPLNNNLYDLGKPALKWRNAEVLNYFGCPLPTAESALSIVKKIKPSKIREGFHGRRHYFLDSDMPAEYKTKNSAGNQSIEVFHTLGIATQAIRELVEQVESLQEEVLALKGEN